ncbi:MAG: phytanoyl-CoA dioxygenase family protein [Candidatus Latescibacterota bacterium]|nr:phytanoyl-CoA dioxygenase family protein [Candidatus Latescibacterota bacterium]
MRKLDQQQMQQFETDGYVVVREFLEPDIHIAPVLNEYETVLDRLARALYAQGKIQSLYKKLAFTERLTKVYAESGEVHSQWFDFSLPQKDIREDTPFWFGPEVFKLLNCEPLLDIAEQFVGTEVYSTPVQHVRIKPPESAIPGTLDNRVIETPWHQDNGVLLEDADETNMLTIWFPLTPATEEMGCLKVRPGSHLEGLTQHCILSNGLGIPDPILPGNEGIALPMMPGDVLFMHSLTCHGSYPNVSDQVRISFDLRYNPVGQSTGREDFPGFVARSRTNSESVLTESTEWEQMWIDARNAIAKEGDRPFNRWVEGDPACA